MGRLVQAILGFTCLGLSGLIPRPAWGNQLDYWRFNAPMSRLEIVAEGTTRPQVQLLSYPTRLVVDLPGTRFGRPLVQRAIGNFVKEVRVGQFNPKTTRLVIELGPTYTMRPQDIKVRGLAPNRWFVQLPKFLALGEAAASPNPVAIPVPDPPPYPRARVVIAVDPGHGGGDPGAIGINGLQEKVVTLDISQRLAQSLQKRGVQAILTRANDQELDLAPRVLRAEQIKARAFVSIHANSLSLAHPEVNGLETYYFASGLPLAQAIHRSILSQIQIRDRGVRQARFYVLRKTSMPAVLVEVGFLTGREDGIRLAQSNYRQAMANAIATGIMRYFRL
ncbi:N-acetylmuramoyl-L-alanine amidase [Thermosynechococcaceae cyanobacterium BACA0444]|uniref:N-acetylmuramoyl-L-alanine amidase n=1 Tax=Pseudocalidococcus azoricus BACA0444 TaxID=2918990 RepID=A0AAE4FPE4_9CYAN|nr:N-acetylmuramoyl-L-alanine amidase [Pseudocalidococcus azoricus]MDS3859299.1 N-acetylmuramoyl-L-alanine amidase [Pseudocalidococcus azoricus BACA0444]